MLRFPSLLPTGPGLTFLVASPRDPLSLKSEERPFWLSQRMSSSPPVVGDVQAQTGLFKPHSRLTLVAQVCRPERAWEDASDFLEKRKGEFVGFCPMMKRLRRLSSPKRRIMFMNLPEEQVVACAKPYEPRELSFLRENAVRALRTPRSRCLIYQEQAPSRLCCNRKQPSAWSRTSLPEQDDCTEIGDQAVPEPDMASLWSAACCRLCNVSIV